nr:hypothetical protein GCM10020093_094510 [Planobispora longispora]
MAAATGTFLLTAGLAFAILMTPITGRFGDPFTGLFQEEAKLFLHALITFLLLAPAAFHRGHPDRFGRFLGGGVMRFLGQISYGIFLWQFVAMEAVFRLTGTPYFNGGMWYVLPLSLALTVVLSALTWYLVEFPLSRLGHSGTAPEPPLLAPAGMRVVGFTRGAPSAAAPSRPVPPVSRPAAPPRPARPAAVDDRGARSP